ncbi:hypothetical protein TL16_g10057 [Triparma laevis f. inornata]|uniref:Uncharacterized protein n=1 Tax=Triparma laevis f. inornata TaxID=1714386 RepID=A0A9W7BA65_9STRA|nr:hypothetical protein TL16_g10057 [Triparma laevis f. inornata]
MGGSKASSRASKAKASRLKAKKEKEKKDAYIAQCEASRISSLSPKKEPNAEDDDSKPTPTSPPTPPTTTVTTLPLLNPHPPPPTSKSTLLQTLSTSRASRFEAKTLKSSALRIQSLIRRFISNRRLLKILTSTFKTLTLTLCTLKKTSPNHLPSQSHVSSYSRIYLHLFSKMSRIEKINSTIIITTLWLNPEGVAPWLQSKEGRLRFKRMLNVFEKMLNLKDFKVSKRIINFLSSLTSEFDSIIGGKNGEEFILKFREYLITTKPDIESDTIYYSYVLKKIELIPFLEFSFLKNILSVKCLEKRVKGFEGLKVNEFIRSFKKIQEMYGENISGLLPSKNISIVSYSACTGLLSNLITFLDRIDLDFLKDLMIEVDFNVFEEGSKAVEWIQSGNSSRAIIIDSEVRQKCLELLSSRSIRILIKRFCDVSDNEEIERILEGKNEEDKLDEQWKKGWTGSAEEMAAREAREGTRRKSWFSSSSSGEKGGSSWAEKLKTGLFGKKKTKTKTEPQLINTSDVSRGLATGQTPSVPLKQQSSLNYDTPKKPYNPSSLKPLIPLLTILISRWSGSGSYDRLRNLKVIGAGRCEGFKGVVNLLCFSEFEVLKRLYLYMINGGGGEDLFSAVFNGFMILTDDSELERVLPMHHVRRIIKRFTKLIERRLEHREGYVEVSFINNSIKLLSNLYDRQSRTPFSGREIWKGGVDGEVESRVKNARSLKDYMEILKSPIMRCLPFTVKLRSRMRLFEGLVRTLREAVQGVNERGTLKPGRRVRIVRGRVLEGGLETMNR